MSLNYSLLKTVAPEFGIYFYTTADGIFVMQVGLCSRFLEIRLG